MVCNHVVILTNCVQITIYNETMIVTLIMLVIALMLRTMLLQTLMMLMVVFADCQMVYCFVQPCAVARCPRYPQATCQ